MTTVLLQPGIYNSGPTHWQSLWEAQHADVRRVQQLDWEHPDCDAWVAALDTHIAACKSPPVLVAHSLGCLVAAHWCASSTRKIRGLLLVALPDPLGPNFPKDAKGFAKLPQSLGARVPILVSSEDDPYSSPAFTQSAVKAWSARHVSLGRAGHINSDSGLGDWEDGWMLVRELLTVSASGGDGRPDAKLRIDDHRR
jgi:uncharacterized protein